MDVPEGVQLVRFANDLDLLAARELVQSCYIDNLRSFIPNIFALFSRNILTTINMVETSEEKEIKRVRRLIARADTKRTIAVNKIRLSIASLNLP